MRLLLDNNLAPRLAPLLQGAGYDVVHVGDVGLGSASDTTVLHYAWENKRILVSADTDFGHLLATSGTSAPSVILLPRAEGRRAAQVADLLVANLPQLQEDLDAGAVVVIRDDTVRIRRLPLPPGQ